MTDHLISPPDERVQQWSVASPIQHSDESWAYELFIAHQAAQWGADQQLDRCTAWMCEYYQDAGSAAAEMMRSDCRPKPPSLKEQALAMLKIDYALNVEDLDLVRRALEQLDD